MTQKTMIIDGVEVPVVPAKAEEEIKNKRTGTIYASKSDFDNDVANPNTRTTMEDIKTDITVQVSPKGLQALQKVMAKQNEPKA